MEGDAAGWLPTHPVPHPCAHLFAGGSLLLPAPLILCAWIFFNCAVMYRHVVPASAGTSSSS